MAIGVLLLGLIVPTQAHAYIDGGTATMLVQLLAGALFASLFFVKQIWFKIKSIFTPKNKN